MTAFKCERCGAPLEVSPETIVAVCPYCGFPNHISGNFKTENMYIAPTRNKNDIAKAFWKRVEEDFDLRRIKDRIQIVDIEGYYTPFWEGTVHVEGEVEYMVREQECETYTDSDGEEHEECHTVERYYHDHIDENLRMMGPARRQVKGFGVKDLMPHYRKNPPKLKKLVELDEDEWNRIKLEILNTEIDEYQAKLMMREDAVDKVRERYSTKADRIDIFDVKADPPENVALVLLPLWTVYYKFENSIYHVVFAGWDGKPLAATEPMSSLRRAQYLGGVIAGMIISALGSAWGGANASAVGPLFAIPIGSYLAGSFGLRILEGQRVERGG